MQNMPDYSKLMQLLATPEGQQLMTLLRSTDNAVLSQAISSAGNGDYQKVLSTLQPVLNTPEARALLMKLGGNDGAVR